MVTHDLAESCPVCRRQKRKRAVAHVLDKGPFVIAILFILWLLLRAQWEHLLSVAITCIVMALILAGWHWADKVLGRR